MLFPNAQVSTRVKMAKCLKLTSLLTSLLLQIFFCVFSFSENSFFKLQEFQELKGRTIQTLAVFDDFQCMLQCQRFPGCSAINLDDKPNKDGLHDCVLLRYERPNKYRSRSLTLSISHHHYIRLGGQCTADRCKDSSAACHQMARGFRCYCGPLGFTEKQCRKGILFKVSGKNCLEVMAAGGTQSGIYNLYPQLGSGPFKVYCDQKTNGGGWTVIQKRKDGSVDFYRRWHDYKTGFGNLTGEFWLGLEKIYRLTNKTHNRLRVELEDWDGNTTYAEYDYFAVANEMDNYTLSFGNYTGTAGDSFRYHQGMAFTTKDRDNDEFVNGNCAVKYKGAWWYKLCHKSNLNGVYHHNGTHSSHADGVNWHAWKGDYYSAKTAEMKIRPA